MVASIPVHQIESLSFGIASYVVEGANESGYYVYKTEASVNFNLSH